MDWQQLVSLAIVGATATLMLWARFRRRRFTFERETLCAGCAASHPAPHYSVVLRARKGERPRMVLKMN